MRLTNWTWRIQYQKVMTHADSTHCVHGKPYEPALRWLLSLDEGGFREYVRYGLFQASSVSSRIQSTRLTTAVAAVCYPVTALNPSGFSTFACTVCEHVHEPRMRHRSIEIFSPLATSR